MKTCVEKRMTIGAPGPSDGESDCREQKISGRELKNVKKACILL